MKDKLNIRTGDIVPLRLHLELKNEFLSDHQKRMLRRYGESPTGAVIRDILVPSDMLLHNLQYVNQKLFGWQNSHLRRSCLPEERCRQLTKGTVRGWSDLVASCFHRPQKGMPIFLGR